MEGYIHDVNFYKKKKKAIEVSSLNITGRSTDWGRQDYHSTLLLHSTYLSLTSDLSADLKLVSLYSRKLATHGHGCSLTEIIKTKER